MANIGSAIAQGIVKGIGVGGQQYFADQRRDKRSKQDMVNAFEQFKKQQDYASTLKETQDKNMAVYKAGLTDIAAKNKARDEWERHAKLSASDLAFEIATKQSEVFSKEMRPAFVRDSLKRLNNLSHPELMVKGGWVLPDYSEYADKPEYQNVIPSPKVAGMDTLPGATDVFKLDLKTLESLQKQEGEKMTDYQRKKADEFSAMDSMGLVTYGATLDESVKNLVWKNRPSGKAVEMKGAEAISYDQTYINSLISSGKAVQVGTELRLAKEVELEDLAMAQRTQQISPEIPTDTALYTEPRTEEYLTKQEEKAQAKERKAEVRRVEDKKGKVIKSYKALEDLLEAAESLSPEANDILFGGVSARGMLSITDWGKKLAAKADVKGAKEARRFLTLMENTSAPLKHDQYGATQTASELKGFADQLGNPSILQNPETLMDQIRTRLDLVGSDLTSSVSGEARKAYLEAHPEASKGLVGLFRREPIEAVGGTKPTVSDMSKEKPAINTDELIAAAPPEFQEELKQALATGKATPEDVRDFLLDLQR